MTNWEEKKMFLNGGPSRNSYMENKFFQELQTATPNYSVVLIKNKQFSTVFVPLPQYCLWFCVDPK